MENTVCDIMYFIKRVEDFTSTCKLRWSILQDILWIWNASLRQHHYINESKNALFLCLSWSQHSFQIVIIVLCIFDTYLPPDVDTLTTVMFVLLNVCHSSRTRLGSPIKKLYSANTRSYVENLCKIWDFPSETLS